MDVNEEAMAVHKCAFLDFLDQDVSPLVTAHFHRRLLQWFVADFFGPCVCRSDAVTEVARNLDPKFFGPCVCRSDIASWWDSWVCHGLRRGYRHGLRRGYRHGLSGSIGFLGCN
ncbi:hypothetical protein GUJ93_ZPchr0010g9963 [Zizania palustris]|uniref:Uncharacterized protein n=1 Tax=Zizania palustris TaxID=103762 RepID=A0A8J5W811_ZIZPA|nr:hypothetical protein GUJ93_ZPchr0010g9963 [Zizania palustris]